ncbi:MAG: hypothetical protein WDO74_25655 [Pseudomonadota bacterium]
MKLVNPRDLAQRSLGLMTSVASFVQRNKGSIAPSALLLVIRSANQLAEHILNQPLPVATPAQRRTLLALSTQLRAMAARIVVTADARQPQTVEAELTELIRRTLEIVERACAEPPAIEPGRGNVIDVEAIEN